MGPSVERLERLSRLARALLASSAPPPEARTLIEANLRAMDKRLARHMARAGLGLDHLLDGAAEVACYITENDGLPEPVAEADVAMGYAFHELLVAAARSVPAGGATAARFYCQTPIAQAAKRRADALAPAKQRPADPPPPPPPAPPPPPGGLADEGGVFAYGPPSDKPPGEPPAPDPPPPPSTKARATGGEGEERTPTSSEAPGKPGTTA